MTVARQQLHMAVTGGSCRVVGWQLQGADYRVAVTEWHLQGGSHKVGVTGWQKAYNGHGPSTSESVIGADVA